MTPMSGVLGAERVLQRLRGERGQDDATETGRRATPQAIVLIVRKMTENNLVECLVYSQYVTEPGYKLTRRN